MDPPELLEDHSRLAGCLFSGTSGESTQPDLVGQFATCGSEEVVTFSVAPTATYCVEPDPVDKTVLGEQQASPVATYPVVEFVEPVETGDSLVTCGVELVEEQFKLIVSHHNKNLLKYRQCLKQWIEEEGGSTEEAN